jgi:hypothetical protein
MPDAMLDWGWKAAGAIGSAVVPTLVGLLFRSPKISGARCEACQRCNDYQVVGGFVRGLAVLLGIGGIAVAMFGAYMLVGNKEAPLVCALIIAGGFVNELIWLRIARQHQNSLKCVACGDLQPLTSYDDHDDVNEATAPIRRKRRKRRARKRS